MAYTPALTDVASGHTVNSPEFYGLQTHFARVSNVESGEFIHTDSVYSALFNAASAFQDDGSCMAAGQVQRREHSRRTETDHDGSCFESPCRIFHLGWFLKEGNILILK